MREALSPALQRRLDVAEACRQMSATSVEVKDRDVVSQQFRFLSRVLLPSKQENVAGSAAGPPALVTARRAAYGPRRGLARCRLSEWVTIRTTKASVSTRSIKDVGFCQLLGVTSLLIRTRPETPRHTSASAQSPGR